MQLWWTLVSKLHCWSLTDTKNTNLLRNNSPMKGLRNNHGKRFTCSVRNRFRQIVFKLKRLKSIYWRDCRKLLCPGDLEASPHRYRLFSHNLFFCQMYFLVKCNQALNVFLVKCNQALNAFLVKYNQALNVFSKCNSRTAITHQYPFLLLFNEILQMKVFLVH